MCCIYWLVQFLVRSAEFKQSNVLYLFMYIIVCMIANKQRINILRKHAYIRQTPTQIDEFLSAYT
jgi:hypothetical protein